MAPTDILPNMFGDQCEYKNWLKPWELQTTSIKAKNKKKVMTLSLLIIDMQVLNDKKWKYRIRKCLMMTIQSDQYPNNGRPGTTPTGMSLHKYVITEHKGITW